MSDPINSPQHYADGPPCAHCGKPIEAIVITERMNFNIGNAMKYLWRAGKKDPAKNLEDIRKAHWYVSREIGRLVKAVRSPAWFYVFDLMKPKSRVSIELQISNLTMARIALEDQIAELAAEG